MNKAYLIVREDYEGHPQVIAVSLNEAAANNYAEKHNKLTNKCRDIHKQMVDSASMFRLNYIAPRPVELLDDADRVAYHRITQVGKRQRTEADKDLLRELRCKIIDAGTEHERNYIARCNNEILDADPDLNDEEKQEIREMIDGFKW